MSLRGWSDIKRCVLMVRSELSTLPQLWLKPRGFFPWQLYCGTKHLHVKSCQLGTVLVSIIIMTEHPMTEFSYFLWLNTLLKFLKPFRNDFSPTLGDKSLSGFEVWQAGYIGMRVNSISFFAPTQKKKTQEARGYFVSWNLFIKLSSLLI